MRFDRCVDQLNPKLQFRRDSLMADDGQEVMSKKRPLPVNRLATPRNHRVTVDPTGKLTQEQVEAETVMNA
jgi:hypothetical protein